VSAAHQLLSARISGICSRHRAQREIDDPDAAVADLRSVAVDRLDCSRRTQVSAPGSPKRACRSLGATDWAEHDLWVAAGAGREQIEPWIKVGAASGLQKHC
jgi:hypothetical protein